MNTRKTFLLCLMLTTLSQPVLATNYESDPQYSQAARDKQVKTQVAAARFQASSEFAAYAASCGNQLSDAEKINLVDNIQISQNVYERVTEAEPSSSKTVAGHTAQNLNRDIATRGCDKFALYKNNLSKAANYSQRDVAMREYPGYTPPAKPTIDQANGFLKQLAKLK